MSDYYQTSIRDFGRPLPQAEAFRRACRPTPPENQTCRCGHSLNHHDSDGCAMNASCLCKGFVRSNG